MSELVTEVTRGTENSAFSIDELFYRYFDRMPLLFYRAGSTDLYDNCPRAASGKVTCDGDEEDIEPDPHKGPQELQTTIDKLRGFITEKEIEDIDFDDESSIHIAKYCNFPDNQFIAFVIFREHDVVARLSITPSNRETMTSVSLLGGDEQSPVWEALVSFCKGYIAPPRVHQDEINIITMSDGEFYLKSIPLTNRNRQEFTYDFYNEDFKPISQRVLNTLQSANESGLVLFHGNPGTGKTSYLKYLLHTITKKKLIYLPPDLIESLSAPSFISFLLSQASNSILLIEDAENVLRHREAGGNQAVSNILNISDGILGDVLRLQIVCTFNSKLSDIDQALLRPGRLVAEYRFEKLTADRTTVLMHKLYGENVTIPDHQMSLAEIFNFNRMPDKTKTTKSSFGFVNTSNEN